MKTNFLPGKVILLLLGGFFAVLLMAGMPSWRGGATAGVQVDFGRGPGCDGPRGLCSVGESEGAERSPNSDAAGSFSLLTNGNLRLSIAKTNISVSEAGTQFAGGVFKQEEAIVIPVRIMGPLGENQARTIPAGDYPVTESKTHFFIDFFPYTQND